MAVLRPLKVVIDNYPEGQIEEMDAVNNPEDASAGTRKVPFSPRAVYRAAMISGKIRPKDISVCLRDKRCACAMDISSPRKRNEECPG